MIPDDVEKIIMTKEDYDRNVEQLLLDKCKAELEVERLNNIINELEKWLVIEIKFRKVIGKDFELRKTLNILQVLKGSDKE